MMSSRSPAREAINAQSVDFLLSPAGRAAAHDLRDADLGEGQTLPLLGELRQRFAADEAGALLALARLRQRAQTKFGLLATSMFFTGEALEQATAQGVADHRAAWIDAHAPTGPLLDLGCGIGGDLLALARRRPIVAYERDPLRLALARANLEAAGLAERVEFRQADWTLPAERDRLATSSFGASVAAFVDPARRVNGRRVFRLRELQPPIEAILPLRQQVALLGVKVMPSVADAEIDALPADGSGPVGTWRVEFVSHERTCKEAVLWWQARPEEGQPAGGARRWASVCGADGVWRRIDSGGAPPPLGDLYAGQLLYEPDPAVIRAGAFAELCAQLGAHLFDPQIAYLVANAPPASTNQAEGDALPFVQPFRVLEVHAFGLKRLNARLRSLDVGRLEIKKRGAPIEPETLRPRLKLNAQSPRAAVVFLTRRGDEPLMILGERASPGA